MGAGGCAGRVEAGHAGDASRVCRQGVQAECTGRVCREGMKGADRACRVQAGCAGYRQGAGRLYRQGMQGTGMVYRIRAGCEGCRQVVQVGCAGFRHGKGRVKAGCTGCRQGVQGVGKMCSMEARYAEYKRGAGRVCRVQQDVQRAGRVCNVEARYRVQAGCAGYLQHVQGAGRVQAGCAAAWHGAGRSSRLRLARGREEPDLVSCE